MTLYSETDHAKSVIRDAESLGYHAHSAGNDALTVARFGKCVESDTE